MDKKNIKRIFKQNKLIKNFFMGKPEVYALFRKNEDGTIEAMIDSSIASMGWSTTGANVWNTPPTHYFRPELGHFIVKITRIYPDIEFTGNRCPNRPRNLEWKLKKNIN